MGAPRPSFRIFYYTWYHGTVLCQIYILNWDTLQGFPGFVCSYPCRVWCRVLTKDLLYVSPLRRNIVLNDSWSVSFIECFLVIFLFIHIYWQISICYLFIYRYLISSFSQPEFYFKNVACPPLFIHVVLALSEPLAGATSTKIHIILYYKLSDTTNSYDISASISKNVSCWIKPCIYSTFIFDKVDIIFIFTLMPHNISDNTY